MQPDHLPLTLQVSAARNVMCLVRISKMIRRRDVRGLWLYTLLGQVASFLVMVFGAIFVFLYFDPTLIGTPAEQIDTYKHHIICLLAGLFFSLFGAYCLLGFGRRRHKLLWILNSTSPVIMNFSIEVEDGDQTIYFALIGREVGRIEWKLALYAPSWDIKFLGSKNNEAKVYFDPKNGEPAVLESEYGLLWGMAGNGAAQKWEQCDST